VISDERRLAHQEPYPGHVQRAVSPDPLGKEQRSRRRTPTRRMSLGQRRSLPEIQSASGKNPGPWPSRGRCWTVGTMILCQQCDTASVGLYCIPCATRKISRLEGGVAGADPHVSPANMRVGFPPVAWNEVRRTALGFLDWPALVVDERPDGLDWFVNGQCIQIRYKVIAEDVLSVSLRTDIAEFPAPASAPADGLSPHERALRLADLLNRDLPMSVLIVLEERLQLRCVVNVSPTGRTMLRVLHAAALLHAYFAMAVQRLINHNQEAGLVKVIRDGHFEPDESTPDTKAVLGEILLNNDPWLLSRWAGMRKHLTQTMGELGYRPGWGNEEVQFYNEAPPDVAIAVLDPEASRVSDLGRGVVVQARIVSPHEMLKTPPADDMNTLNVALLDTGLSVLGGFSGVTATQVGLMVDLWIPVAGVVDPALSDSANATSLGNLAVHVAHAPFAVHRRLRQPINP